MAPSEKMATLLSQVTKQVAELLGKVFQRTHGGVFRWRWRRGLVVIFKAVFFEKLGLRRIVLNVVLVEVDGLNYSLWVLLLLVLRYVRFLQQLHPLRR